MVLNVTRNDDKWQALSSDMVGKTGFSDNVLANQIAFGKIYRQTLRTDVEAMGYEEVEVTKASGDKGVDVIGKVQVGITTITEVVQVKRMQNTITRPYIDQLRGALPYHKAIRGTLITTGKFAAKCAEAALFPGAAPITLIDGDRLLEMLIENNVGIRRSNAVELLDVDLQLFDELEIE